MSYTSLTDALPILAARLPQAVREREILRIVGTLGGKDAAQTAAQARREALIWAENRTGGRLPSAAWNHEDFEYFVGGRDCSAVRIVDDSRDIWAIRANDPDKNVPQRVWTVEATVGRRLPEGPPLFGLRLLAGSPEHELLIEPAVPGLALQVATACGLYRGSERLTAESWVIESGGDAEALVDMLLNPERQLPMFVLTVPEHAIEVVPLLDAASLARATLGLAKVVIVPAHLTWALTDRFGRRLSVFGGAVRVYLPGFTEDANPYGGHQLFLGDRVASAGNQIVTRLRQIAATESLRRLRMGREVLSYASVREQAFELRRARLAQEGATDLEQLSAAKDQIDYLTDELKKAVDEQQWLYEEHAAAEERARGAEAQLIGAGYRIQQLTEQLRERGHSPDATMSLPTKWAEFADWCDQNLVGRVLLTPRARNEVKAPLFRDVETAAKCLLWLANDYRERRLGGGDLRAKIEGGFKNDRCGADSFQIEWQGSRADVQWHIKNGGNTRDPVRCLRIYYFWNEASQQVVIASMPAHIRSGAT